MGNSSTIKASLERADRFLAQGDWESARASCMDVLAVDAMHGEAMLQLSYVESLAGHYRAAREWTLRAVEAVDTEGGVLSLLRRLRTFNQASEIRRIADRALQDTRKSAGVLMECALQASNLNDHGLAMRCAEEAVAAAPGSVPARLVRGQMLAQHGGIGTAEEDFDWVLARAPGAASAYWSLSRLRKQSNASNHVGRLQAVLAKPSLRTQDAAPLAFALHKELDDLGEVRAAWNALMLACRAKRSLLKYDSGQSRKLVDALVAMPPRGSRGSDRQSDRIPIFIVGMHRSGTTLLEQLLDASPQVRGVGELYDFTSAMRYATDHHCKGVIDRTIVERARDVDFAEVGKRYLDGMAWRLGDERFFTDKLPSNFLNIGFICRALPQAKILHMVRDPVETCFSNLRELFSEANPYSYDQLELADYFIQYRRLMAHWHAAYPGRILDVDYAELTRDPESVMRKVAAFCGIDYVDAMRDPRNSTRAVSTASAVQVRDKVVRREVPKWAPYAQHLQPLIAALRQGGVEVPELPA